MVAESSAVLIQLARLLLDVEYVPKRASPAARCADIVEGSSAAATKAGKPRTARVHGEIFENGRMFGSER